MSYVAHSTLGSPVIMPPADVRIKCTHRTLDSNRRYTAFTEYQTWWLYTVCRFICLPALDNTGKLPVSHLKVTLYDYSEFR